MNKAIKHLLIFLFFFFFVDILLPLPSFADEPMANDADKQFSFASSLFKEGDYFRAISEYKRFIYYFPKDERVEKAYFGITECYFSAKRWQESIDSVNQFLLRYPNSGFLKDALWIKGVSQKNLKKYDESLSTFMEIAQRDRSELGNKAIYQIALVYVDQENWDKARESFLRIPENSMLFPSARRFSEGIEHIRDVPQKSPGVAGALAAVLPGAGHLYTERPRDALVSFLLNGAFIVAAVELFRHDEYVTGGIVTFFEVGWYAGNIYSAVSSAHKYNKASREEFIQRLQDQNPLSIYHDPSRSTTYVMYNFRY